MRTSVVVAFLVLLTVAGCSSKPEDVYDTPAPGRDAAFAAARTHDPTAQLVGLLGAEPATDNTDDGFAGLDKHVWAKADATVGDGKARVWLWTFRGEDGSGWQVLTSADKVVKQRAPDAEGMEDLLDGGGIVDEPGSTRVLLLDTAGLAAQLDAMDASWRASATTQGGLLWGLAGTTPPTWNVVVPQEGTPSERVYTFDAYDGRLLDVAGTEKPAFLRERTLGLTDCNNLGGVFPVPMDAARAALPAGFEPVASPNDPQGGATLYVLVLQCAGSQVDGNETGPTAVAYAEVAVVPPAEFKLDGVSDFTVPLAIGASSDAVGARLAEWMLGVAGPSTVSDVTDGSPGPMRASMTVAGVTLGVTGQAVPNPGVGIADGDFALIGAQGGSVKSVVRGHAQGGSVMQAGVSMESEGLPLLEQARPAAAGFRVTGFSLTFTLASLV